LTVLHASASGASKPRRLLARYWRFTAGLIAATLCTLGGADLWLSYRDNIARSAAIQLAEARSAGGRIDVYLRGVERAMRDTAQLAWGSGLLDRDAQREEFIRLLKLLPLVVDLTAVDSQGRERLFVSRIAPDRIDAGTDLSPDPRVRALSTRDAAYGPPYFLSGAAPHVALSLRGFDARADGLLATLNLKFVGEVLASVRIGESGIAFAVDDKGRLLAHPDASLVLRQTDLSGELLLQRARERMPSSAMAPASLGSLPFRGEQVFASAMRLSGPDWIVFVTQPADEVLAGVRVSAYRLLLLVALALSIAFLASRWFADRLVQPILDVARGARRFGAGELGTRIQVTSGDEVQDLAQDFNRMAQEIQQYTAGLERLVAEKTRDLQQANEHKTAFLAHVSHELRTPLNAVIGFSEALEEELFGTLNEKQREYVNDIKGSGLHLLALINDLLDLSKIEAGKMDLDLAPVDVRAALDGALNLVRARALQGGVQLSIDAPTEFSEFVGDARRLRQILLNLLSNAVKFTRPGGTVRLSASDSEAVLTLIVTDTGVGIAPDELTALFEPFAQAAGGGEARAEGTGLGLALTRRLVELHGGRIDIASKRGAGSTFTVQLPRRRATTAVGARESVS